MNYWHMQLHPDDKKWGKEKELLDTEALIGLGDWEGRGRQTDNFKEKMAIDDIVLIRLGHTVIALVEVIGNLEDNLSDNKDRLDWFRYRRKVKVLNFATSKMKKFPQARGTLQHLIDKKTESYQYIHNWYIKIIQEQYRDKDLIDGSYKLKELYIENFKMFNRLKVDFTDKDKNILPVIVIAGKNGTGKTTLLEYLANIKITNNDYVKISKIREVDGLEEIETDDNLIVDNFRLIDGIKGIKSKKDEYKNHIIYLPVDINKTNSIEEAIVDYYINISEAKDLRPSEIINELQKFIDGIFNTDFNLSFMIKRVDLRTRQVFFKNDKNIEVYIDSLSTGEKTLLSKVLYLYFKDIKNQIILIDEPELSLHPDWQNRVLKLYENFAKENNCQIIIATHSPHIIGSAKAEYLRILTKDNDRDIEVDDNISKSYGLEFNKVLTDIMGIGALRTPYIADKIKVLWGFLENEEYENKEYLELYNELENTLGDLDENLILARLEVAKIKSQNA